MARPVIYYDPVALRVRMPRALHEQLRAQATGNGLSMNNYIVNRLAEVPMLVINVAPKPEPAPPQPRVPNAPTPNACPHPRARRRNAVGGKICLDCHEKVEG